MSKTVRIAAVSYAPPLHDHHKLGVNLSAIREVALRVAEQERPDFICFPEICSCLAGTISAGVNAAPELAPYAAEVGKLARDVNAALIVPCLERYMGQVFNSVPIVNRAGQLVMVYRKNYPTMGEMDEGVCPGWEIPVADCDGVRVGAAVCYDANFDNVPAELERQRARVVFWPSMFWGGALLQHWSLRYGFYTVVAYGAESAVIDMSGRYLVKQGADTWQVRSNRLPAWAVAEINTDREVYHLDKNQNQFPAIRAKYGPDVQIEVYQPEAYFLLASRRDGLSVEQIAAEFQLETLRDYLARAVRQRTEFHQRTHLPRK